MRLTTTLNPWLRWPRPNPAAGVRLFCFPYAGGGAMTYRTWGEVLPATVEVCPIQLPGREDRLRETPFTELQALVQTLSPIIQPYLDKPFAFFGHSMGALIAYELTRELWRQVDLLPVHLFVSGRGAPQLPSYLPPIHTLPDAAFLTESQRRYGGIPAMLWQEAELRALLLPLLRADLTLVETYTYTPAPPLPCALTASGGTRDKQVGQADLAAWRTQVQDDFHVQRFEGDHFYLNYSPQPLLQAIGTALSEGPRRNPSALTAHAPDSDFP